MAFRAVSSFPARRRSIAESNAAVAALVGSPRIEVNESGAGNNDHSAIRANVLDILGQILNYPIGDESVGAHCEDLDPNAEARGGSDVMKSCNETQTMQRWCGGKQRTLGDFLKAYNDV